jgi:hypothetical protein
LILDIGQSFRFLKFDGKRKVVATINDSETGNDVIEGRQPTGSLPTLQNFELTSMGDRIAKAAPQPMIG